jgi:hypothetical protein
MLIVDVRKSPIYSQRLELDGDGVDYLVRTSWSTKYQRFYMDILDIKGNPFVLGVKLVPGGSINL